MIVLVFNCIICHTEFSSVIFYIYIATQEDRFMQSWLQLVNERNGLVRKITELSLRWALFRMIGVFYLEQWVCII